MMTLESLAHRKVKQAAIVVVAVMIAVVLMVVWQENQKRQYQKSYEQRMQILKSYLRDARRVPTPEEINALTRHYEYLKNQKDRIDQVFHSENSFAKAYSDVQRPLEFRELLSQTRTKFDRSDVGFSDFLESIPAAEQLPQLKRYLSLIENVMELANQNRIKSVDAIVRRPVETVEEYKTTMMVKYPILVTMTTRFEELYRLLYDLASQPSLMIVDAIRVIEKPNYDLDVTLKITYVEIP